MPCGDTVALRLGRKMDRSYSELITLPSFKERAEYLMLSGVVGQDTFGGYRWANQRFYTSSEWRRIRDLCIIRDTGLDLAHEGYPIYGPITVHHINPITIDDVVRVTSALTDLENLICVSPRTHKLIHYGDMETLAMSEPTIRLPNDTCPWKGGTIGRVDIV